MTKKNEVVVAENTIPVNIDFDTKPQNLVDVSKLKVRGHIILPTLSIKNIKEGDTFIVRAHSEITSSEQVDPATGEIKLSKFGKPSLIHTMQAQNVQTGQIGQMVLPALVHSGLSRAGAITGRIFALRKGESRGMGKANEWECVEVYEGE